MSTVAKSPLTPAKTDRFVHAKRTHALQKAINKAGHQNDIKLYQNPPKYFLSAPCEQMTIRIPPKAEREAMRTEFEQGKRAEFFKYLAKNKVKELRAAGISKKEIKRMEEGFTPHGFNTHHKLPIFCGGTNDWSNLVLIRREPYHDMMHYHLINPQVRHLHTGDECRITIPNPKDLVYVPKPHYKFLEKWAKKGHKTYGKNKNKTLREVLIEAKRIKDGMALLSGKGR